MAGLTENDVQSQIEQMIKFIRQEAEEKAEEIRVKAEEDFNIMKQEEVETEKKRIRQDYERKEKQVDVEKKIAHSNAINQNRLKVLKAREDSVDQIKEKALQKIAKFAEGKGYNNLLKDLIIQGALSMGEANMEVQCRRCDVKKVEGVLSDAQKEATKRGGKPVKLTLSDTKFLPDGGKGPNACSGGVVLSALNGAIKCDNTLDTRLKLAFQGLLPQVRITLFGRSATRKHLN